MRAAIEHVVSDGLKSFVVEDCGHFVMEEQPTKTAEILSQFFEKIDRPV